MAEKAPKITPMMRQYLQVKQELPEDAILLFRMGDFYELFFEDAVKGSELMEITLTKRAGVPMAGIPYHALKNYLPKIIESGTKVAIAEQVEDPKTAKGIVKREVTQIITPGTILDSNILSAGQSNFIVGIFKKNDNYGIASLDISTGEFKVTECDSRQNFETEINSLNPAECIIPSFLEETIEESKNSLPVKITWTPVDDWTFDQETAEEMLQRQFGVLSLDGFGCRGMKAGISAAGAVLYYATNNLRRNADHIKIITTYSNSAFMSLDRISQRNLELVTPIFTDSKNATLLSVLDKCVTPMGRRLIRDWIIRPLQDKAVINSRLDAVETLFEDQILLTELREILNSVRDLERTVSRLNLGSANARDLMNLQRGLCIIPELKQVLACIDEGLLDSLNKSLIELTEISELIDNAIDIEAPLTIKDGGIIKAGYHELLDELRSAATEGKRWIAELQAAETEKTGIKNLKIKYNKVFGYFLEVSHANKDLVPETWIRKQTLVNAERYITPELKEIEDKILGSEDKSKALEYELFQEVRQKVIAETTTIQSNARAIANIDTLASLAHVALSQNYTRPTVNDGYQIGIVEGRHPVVDALMEEESFVPNDTLLDGDENRLAIITGPNMAGKSTYIRQVALITIMAQIGSFVPAQKAEIGIVDRIFTRIGAADDLSRGQSTFMVEMVETANILNNATERSLIILDEIGRGTSTFDGLSLAWAIAEFILDDKRSRTLFATHYHELVELKMTSNGVQNYNVAVSEWKDQIIFLRKIVPGGTDKSYGIQVARLAGLPLPVVNRAKEILGNLENKELDKTGQPVTAKHHEKAKKATKKKKKDTQTMLLDFGEEYL